RAVKLAALQLLQKLQVPSYLHLLQFMLVIVNLAMPHGTCSLATAGGPPV
ncbi:unnamed protein product, partial [Staurois parvus]